MSHCYYCEQPMSRALTTLVSDDSLMTDEVCTVECAMLTINDPIQGADFRGTADVLTVQVDAPRQLMLF